MGLDPKSPAAQNCPVVLGSLILAPPSLFLSHAIGWIPPSLNIRGKLKKKKAKSVPSHLWNCDALECAQFPLLLSLSTPFSC